MKRRLHSTVIDACYSIWLKCGWHSDYTRMLTISVTLAATTRNLFFFQSHRVAKRVRVCVCVCVRACRCVSVRCTLHGVRRVTSLRCRTLPASVVQRSCAVWLRLKPFSTRTWACCMTSRRPFLTWRQPRGMTTTTGEINILFIRCILSHLQLLFCFCKAILDSYNLLISNAYVALLLVVSVDAAIKLFLLFLSHYCKIRLFVLVIAWAYLEEGRGGRPPNRRNFCSV